jgi:lipopolysaccharide assembly outer membrane protein LptD (OstA)
MIRHFRPHRALGRSLALGVTLPLALFVAAPALGQTVPAAGPVTLTADHIQYDTQSGDVAADGHVQATRGDTVITADHLTGNLKSGDVRAAGNVKLTQAGRTAAGSSLAYNFRTRAGRMEQVVAAYGPWTVRSQTLETSAGRGVATNTSITPCDPAHPAFLVKARKVVVVPDDHLTAYDATLVVYGVAIGTIPQYTESLNPGRKARSGPSLGYSSGDGVWVEYSQYFPIGGADNQLRIRYGTVSGLTGEDILSQRVADHVWSLHMGRAEAFDQGGNLSELDQYSLDLSYNRSRIADWPVYYTLEGHVGHYAEHLPAAVTNAIATRAEGWLNVSSGVFNISPDVIWSWSAQAREDVYDTGQNRTVLGYAIAVTDVLDASSSVTLTYNLASVTGATPFAFDAISNDSTVSLSYGYSSPGVLQSGGVSLGYSFLSQQTSLGVNAALALSAQAILSAAVSYNLSTQTTTEADYALNVKCDCVSVGLLYRTFPQTPSQNAFYLTIGLAAFPETFNTVKF